MPEKSIAGVNVPLLTGALVTLALAGMSYPFFAPSPHGFLELVFTVPLFCLGFGLLAGAFFADEAPTFRRTRYLLGALCMALAATPVIWFVWLLAF